MDIGSFMIFLVIAIVCTISAELVLSRSVPGGIFSTIIVGFLGAWSGASVMWQFGPVMEGVPLITTTGFSAIAIFFFYMITGGFSHTWD